MSFLIDQDMEFMPIVPLGEEELKEEEKGELPLELPLIALRNTVLFPNVVVPITVSREKSLKAIEAAQNNNKWIAVVAQKEGTNDNPNENDIFHTGTIAKIMKQIKMPDGNLTLFIMGRVRFSIEKFIQTEPYFSIKPQYLEENFPKNDIEFEALISNIKEHSEQIVQLTPNMPPEAAIMLKNIEQPSFLLHFIASNMQAKPADKQLLLEQTDIKSRAQKILELLQGELQMATLKNEINNKARGEMDKQQREYFLQQQLKSIKEELGADNDREIKDLKKRAESIKMPVAVQELFQKNIEKLERMHPTTPDYSVVYNHLDLLLDLPWDESTVDNYDIKRAKKILDADHFGMDKIKDRILEYLAVINLRGDLKSPILCFIGPPGIGKTSLGKSIANAIERKYVRLSLGGLHDESELRGHRKTYIGAMPGRIIQNLRKIKSNNPVFILDEIDKIGKDFRGDPSSALLEILDPEQNNTFYDNYLELEFDLSKILFIATANSLQEIQPALRDRLEIIDLSGYSIEEKVQIAQKHLLPKQRQMHGIKDKTPKINNDVFEKIISEYTRESGVRDLERKIAAILRNVVKEMALDENPPALITNEDVIRILGKPRFNNDLYKNGYPTGVVVGLAWTYVGGDILFIETSLNKGKGGLTLTGNLGNVMKESATTALSFLKAHAAEIGIEDTVFAEKDIHIHVPEGATPKDGPSAGITMLTSLASAFTNRKVKPFIAMTGEITLRGQVLPVGGIKEKILAAKRAGIKEIILCEQNVKDIEEINKAYIKGIKFHYVNEMHEVLEIALVKK